MVFVISTFHGIILQMKHRKRISLYNYQSPTITQPTGMFSMPIYSTNDIKGYIQILQKETQKRLLFIQNTGYLMVVSNATILTLVETSQAFFKTSEKFVDSPIV